MKDYYRRCIPIYLSSLVLGIATDLLVMSDRSSHRESPFSIGFFIIVPCAVILLSNIIHLHPPKGNLAAAFLGTTVFFCLMVFGFWFYEQRRGWVSDMYGLFYLLGAVPSAVLGAIYGKALLKKELPPNQAL